jgi:hypothetical protein
MVGNWAVEETAAGDAATSLVYKIMPAAVDASSHEGSWIKIRSKKMNQPEKKSMKCDVCVPRSVNFFPETGGEKS